MKKDISINNPPAEGAEEQCQCCDGTGMCENIDGEKGACMTCNGSGKWKWPQPTADGAEEYLKANLSEGEDMVISDRLRRRTKELMNGFATLHAQRIAEKMVEERLKEDTYMTCDVCGCHPSVIITTSFGKFCQQHAKYI